MQVCPFDAIEGPVPAPYGIPRICELGVTVADSILHSDEPTGSFPPVSLDGETPAEAEEGIDD